MRRCFVALLAIVPMVGAAGRVQEGLDSRGVDPGFPYPLGCVDRAGYVRPEDLGVRSPACVGVGDLLRRKDAQGAQKALATLPIRSEDEAIVKRKYTVDRFRLTNEVRKYWKEQQREMDGFTRARRNPSLDLVVGRAYAAEVLLEQEKKSAPELIQAVQLAIKALKSEEGTSTLEMVALASFQVSVAKASEASATLQKALKGNPWAYTVRMARIWTLAGNGSSDEGSLRGAERERLNREAYAEARVILEHEDTYGPALIEAGSLAKQLGKKEESRRFYRRFLELAPADHRLRKVIEREVGN